MIDNQWPSHICKNYDLNGKRKYLIDKIEDFFEKKFSYPVTLFPSARAGLGGIFDYLNITRKDLCYVPKWSSHCIYNTFGAYSSITNLISKYISLALVVHKWGYNYNTPLYYENNIIEDSVDSIHLSNKAFFPNGNSDFEIISLPKVIGVMTGGLVVSKNLSFKKFISKNRSNNDMFSKYQSNLKWGYGGEFDVWNSLEYKNRNIEIRDLNNICLNLDNYEKNKDIIIRRYNFLKNHFSIISFGADKIGPLVPFDCELYNVKNKNKFMVRNFNFCKDLESEKFKPAFLLPIHFGIEDSLFKSYTNNIFPSNK